MSSCLTHSCLKCHMPPQHVTVPSSLELEMPTSDRRLDVRQGDIRLKALGLVVSKESSRMRAWIHSDKII